MPIQSISNDPTTRPTTSDPLSSAQIKRTSNAETQVYAPFKSTLASAKTKNFPSSFFSKALEWIKWPFTSLYNWIYWIICCCPKEERSKPDANASIKAMLASPKDFSKNLKNNLASTLEKLTASLLKAPVQLLKSFAEKSKYDALVKPLRKALKKEKTNVPLLYQTYTPEDNELADLLNSPIAEIAEHLNAVLENIQLEDEADSANIDLLKDLFQNTIPDYCKSDAGNLDKLQELFTQLKKNFLTTGDLLNPFINFITESIIKDPHQKNTFNQFLNPQTHRLLGIENGDLEVKKLRDRVTHVLFEAFGPKISQHFLDGLDEKPSVLTPTLKMIKEATADSETAKLLANAYPAALREYGNLGKTSERDV